MGKHAYLIMAHSNLNQLCSLIKCLDYDLNDIYIHIDAHVKSFSQNNILAIANKSKVFLTKRIKVNWGAYSQIEARFILLQTARDNGSYDFYHFISGLDLPLYSPQYIHTFFDSHKDEEFISIDDNPNRNIERIRYYYPCRDIGIDNRKLIAKVIYKLSIHIQKTLKINRLKESNITFYFGEAWFSVTEKFVDFVLKNKSFCDKYFKYGYCSDELVFATLYMMCDDKNARYLSPYLGENNNNLCMDIVRAIDWNRGTPYTYTLEDYDMLMQSHCMFARKFDENKDSRIINKIVDLIII